MSIQDAYSKIQQRIHDVANSDKYNHLVNSVNKTKDEQMLYDWIIHLNDNMSYINNTEKNINSIQIDLLESDCRLLISKIKKMLDKLSWI